MENPYKLTPAKMPRQKDYTGHCAWTVTHPNFGAIDVFARDKAGSIVTAAAFWGERWQKYSYYAFCEVVRRK